jgi:hypothetical protein
MRSLSQLLKCISTYFGAFFKKSHWENFFWTSSNRYRSKSSVARLSWPKTINSCQFMRKQISLFNSFFFPSWSSFFSLIFCWRKRRILICSVHIHMHSSVQEKLSILKFLKQKELENKIYRDWDSRKRKIRMRNLDFRDGKNRFCRVRAFLRFSYSEFVFSTSETMPKIRWNQTTVHFQEVLHCGWDRKKCPQSRIERCPDSGGSFPVKIALGNHEVSRIGRCPHREVLLYV